LSLALGGLVLAQSPPATPPAAPAPSPGPAPTAAPADEHTPPPPGATSPDIDIPLRARAQISVEDMRAQVAKLQQQLDEVLRRVVQLQDVARRNKDVIRLNCVNDKLLQVKQLMNIADQARNNLEEAIARGDEEGRYHEFGRVTIVAQQGQTLSGEAENCVGEDLSYLGQTLVTVEEPELPDDPTVVDGPDFPIVEPLPVASPQS
jgi:hypothetical protein